MRRKTYLWTTALVLFASAAWVWAQKADTKPPEKETQAQADDANQGKLLPIAGGSLLIIVSPKNDCVWGYSKHTGMWRKQPLEHPPKESIQPTVSSDCAAFQADKVLYAFSGEKGRWASVSLKGEGEPDIAHYGDMITVQHGESLSVFSAKTASWDTITLEGD